MDIIFSDYESKRLIMADTSSNVIYIMKNDYWGDPVRSKPAYGGGEYTYTPLDEFMIEALNWESFLRALYDIDNHPGKFVHFLLDVYVCSMKRYHDIFADIL